MKCLDCDSERIHARGLCTTHYAKRHWRKAVTPMPPRETALRPYEQIKDPHIRWLFAEMRNQHLSINETAERAGVSRTSLQKQKTRENISLFAFKCVLETLGFEMIIVAKEDQNASNENT